MRIRKKRTRLGPVGQKILLFLSTGLALGLTRRPDHYFRILKKGIREWEKINEESLRRAIKRLYQSKLADCREDANGNITLILAEGGKQKILTHNLDKISIKKPARWDGVWRVVIFDIPERFKNGRDALAAKLKEFGFYPMQKSVFVFPYDCENEIDFIVEFFNLRPYVRFLLVKKTDIDLDLEKRFKL